MPMIIFGLDEKSKGIGDTIIETFRYSFNLHLLIYDDVEEQTCSGVRVEGTFKCFGGGYADTSGPSTPFVFPIEVVTAAKKTGGAVVKDLRAEEPARRPE